MTDRTPGTGLAQALARWRQAGIITPAQAEAIQRLEAHAPADAPTADRFRLNPATLIVYIGAFLVAVASIVFVALGWSDMGRTQQFVWGTLAVAVPWGAAYGLRRSGKPMAVQGSIPLVIAGNVALLLFVYTLYRLAGWWPDHPDRPSSQDTTSQLMALDFAIAAVAAAAIAIWLRLPFMLLLAGGAGWMAWIQIVDQIWRTEGEDPILQTSLYGFALVALGFVVTWLGQRHYAFWLFLVGLAVSFLFVGIDAFDDALGPTGLLFLVMTLAAIGVSLWLEFRVFLLFGAVGLYGWVSALIVETFGGSRPVAFALIVLGAVIVAFGLAWQRWLEPWWHARRGGQGDHGHGPNHSGAPAAG
jgi:uncharacterized membrane protein